MISGQVNDPTGLHRANGGAQSLTQVAAVHVAVPLSQATQQHLAAVLERRFGGPIALHVIIDPGVIGGVWLRVGDTVIDGSLAGRLNALKQHLCAQCRIMMSSGYMPSDESSKD